MGRRALIAMGPVLATTVIAHHRRRLNKGRVRRFTIDLDPTDDPTHGQQKFTFFNGHYDTWCYLLVVATVTLQRRGRAVRGRGRAAARQRARDTRGPGPLAAPAGEAARGLSGGPLRVRLDGGFASARMFAFLEAQPVEYVVALASNPRLEKRARRLMGKTRLLSRATSQTAHLYGDTRYAARTWRRKRRVIIKAEVVRHPGRDPKKNPRFVVTNLPDDPQTVYEQIYFSAERLDRRRDRALGLRAEGTRQLEPDEVVEPIVSYPELPVLDIAHKILREERVTPPKAIGKVDPTAKALLLRPREIVHGAPDDGSIDVEAQHQVGRDARTETREIVSTIRADEVGDDVPLGPVPARELADSSRIVNANRSR